jgi:hypothetical protein
MLIFHIGFYLEMIVVYVCIYMYVDICLHLFAFVCVFYCLYVLKKCVLKRLHKIIGHHMYVIDILVCATYHNVQYYNRLAMC